MNENANSSMSIAIKLVGVLGSAAGSREMVLELKNGTTVQGLVSTLLTKVGRKLFHDLLVESGSEDPRPNVLILLNDQDCNVFDGLRSVVDSGTRITIIPVAHGG